MNATEMNAFFTAAALIDPRMKRLDAREQAAMAIAWAGLLYDVPLDAAIVAMKAHYRELSDTITPARIIELAPIPPAPVLPDITDELVAEDMRKQLAAAGVTEAEWRAHGLDLAWINAHFPNRELEAARD